MTQGEVETETEVAQAEAMARLQNTKLYFGNLPYNCDSEQLAGVIQQHASPEMIEVNTTFFHLFPLLISHEIQVIY